MIGSPYPEYDIWERGVHVRALTECFIAERKYPQLCDGKLRHVQHRQHGCRRIVIAHVFDFARGAGKAWW
jgi:hypothetical protein